MDQDGYIYFEDMVPGRVFRSDRLPPLTAEAIIGFARQFDPQPQHLGDVSAALSNLGVFCASGWHTASMSMRLLADTIRIRGGGMGAGVEVSWPRPTVVGDVLRLEAEVLAARLSSSRPNMGVVTFRATTFNQRDDPVQYCTHTALYPLRMVAT